MTPTRDQLIARAIETGKAKTPEDAARVVDAYLAKKGTPAPTTGAPKTTTPKTTGAAAKPAAPATKPAPKPETPKPAPVVSAQMPDSPRGGRTVYGAGPLPERQAPQFRAPPRPQPAPGPLARVGGVVDETLGMSPRGIPAEAITRGLAPEAAKRTFTARDYMDPAVGPKPAAPTEPRKPPVAAERYMTAGGIADLRRADDTTRRTRSSAAQAAERTLRAAGITGVDDATDDELVTAARNLGR